MVTSTSFVGLEKLLEMGGHDCAHVLSKIQKHTRLLESTNVAGASKVTEGITDASLVVNIGFTNPSETSRDRR